MVDNSRSAPGIVCCGGCDGVAVDDGLGTGDGLNDCDRVGDADGGELELPLQPATSATTALHAKTRVVEGRIVVDDVTSS
jgi:hypothetical protein